MAIPKTSVFVPLSGELDSKSAPLSMASTSLLTCDNVVQERRGQFRRRNGFTQVSADTVPLATGPSFVANDGPSGMIAGDWTGQYYYSDARTSNKWVADTQLQLVGIDDLAREPMTSTILLSALSPMGFSSDGTSHITIVQDSSSGSVTWGIFDSKSNLFVQRSNTIGAGALITNVRCAAGLGFLVGFYVDSATGSLIGSVYNTSTGTWSVDTTVKTGLAASSVMDCMYYSGSAITVVCAMAAGGMRYIEFNPSTRANDTDVALAATFGTTISCLACLPNPQGTGARPIGISSTAPSNSTDIVKFTSTGSFAGGATQVEAVQSNQIVGCSFVGSLSPTNPDVVAIYQTAAGALRRNNIVAGVAGTPAMLNSTSAWSAIPPKIVGQAWGEPGDNKFFFLIENVTTLASADPQATVVMMSAWFNGNIAIQISSVAAGQGSYTSVNKVPFQAIRTGTRSFYFGMPVLSRFDRAASAVIADYELTAFDHTLMSTAEIGTVGMSGAPAYRAGEVIVPTNSLRGSSGTALYPIGDTTNPKVPISATQSAGGSMTSLGVYQYCVVIERLNRNGEIWRSPPSVPLSVTMTAGNNTVTLAVGMWQLENNFVWSRLKIYRTVNLGSTFLLVQTITGYQPNFQDNASALIDTFSDASLASSEILYTTGEQANICWPPSMACWMFDDRLWSVNRDFRTEVNYSKNLRPGFQPEATNANVIDLDDQWGDITNGSSVEGRGVIFKRNAIYFIQGDGLTNSGSGTQYTVNRISDDIGSLPGTVLVNAGDAIFFVSQRGIHSVDAAGNIKFVGAGIDAWFNQPQVNTPEVVYDGIFVPSRNEVRFVTTNYIFVYDRNFPAVSSTGVVGLGQWSRWTGAGSWGGTIRQCLLVADKMVLFGNTGLVWREGTTAQTTDQGTAFTGIVRTAWIRYTATGAILPNPAQTPLRLYNARAIVTRTAGGGNLTATGKIYYNDDDTQVQTFTSQAITGATLSDVGEMFPTQQKCTSFSLEIDLPSADNTLRIDGFAANIGVRVPSEQRRPAGEKWS